MKTKQDTKRVKEGQEMKMDKLSNLPDAILLLILTFLDTKKAVQTSVLSKRWNNVWTHISTLNFNIESFPTMESFQRFVRKVLSLRNPSINLSSLILTMDFYKSLKYRLIPNMSIRERFLSFRNRPPIDKSFIDEVIMNAISHGVQQVDISISHKDELCLTPCLFTCASLMTLRLQNCQPFENVCISRGFASLTTLHLCEASFLIDEYDCVDLFSSCVNLENLFLLECSVRGLGVFIISASRLVNLTISHMAYSWLGKKCQVVISAPRLTSLSYEGYHPLVLSRDQCPVLDRVNICARKTSRSQQELLDLTDVHVALEYFLGWGDMFNGVSHAKQSKFDWDIFHKGK